MTCAPSARRSANPMSADEQSSGRTASRVLVAAESALVRAGLEVVIRQAGPRLALAGASTTLSAVVEATDERQPDVVLLLLEDEEEQLGVLSSLNGASTPRRAPADEPGSAPPAVVVLAEAALVKELLRRGARAVLPRESATEEIVAAVVAASAGLVALAPEAVDSLIAGWPPGRAGDLAPHSSSSDSANGLVAETLTPREVEVLAMLAEGLGNKEIARRLNISEHTVKFHVASILGKLGAASRTEAVSRGIRRGLIML